MTIESTRAPEGAKTATTEASRGKAATGRAAAAGTPGDAGGFADLMSLLSAVDAQSLPVDVSQSTADDVPASDQDDAKDMPLALDDKGLAAISFTAIAAPVVALPTAPTAPTGTPVPAPVSVDAAALVGGKGASDKRQLADQGEAVIATSAPAVASDVNTLLNNRRVSPSPTALLGQVDAREARLQPGNHPLPVVHEAERAAPVLLSVDAVPVSAERRENKSSTGHLRTGLEGVAGGAAADRLGISPTYEIAATAAVVPDTQVAETVSYWATDGVQSADLTLDGLGNEPVEVHISIEGDQTQVDFRSNQPDVRQALESASAQLKTMLSGEGLQLAGMSVGTSGQGYTQSEGRQSKPTPRQTTVVSAEPVRATTVARTGNPSVGRALDLYV
jgi:flagellar hook-length control protein FliK